MSPGPTLPVVDLCAAPLGRSRYHCPCKSVRDGTSSWQDWPHRGIGLDELNNELQRREIAAAGGRRLSARCSPEQGPLNRLRTHTISTLHKNSFSGGAGSASGERNQPGAGTGPGCGWAHRRANGRQEFLRYQFNIPFRLERRARPPRAIGGTEIGASAVRKELLLGKSKHSHTAISRTHAWKNFARFVSSVDDLTVIVARWLLLAPEIEPEVSVVTNGKTARPGHCTPFYPIPHDNDSLVVSAQGVPFLIVPVDCNGGHP